MSKPRSKRPAPGVTQRRNWRSVFLTNLAEMGIVKLAADAAGVGRMTVYDHRERDKAFAAKWDEAMKDAADLLEQEARRRAVDGLVQKKFTKGGEPINDPDTGKQYFERAYSDTLLILLLKGARPDKFRDNVNVTNTGSPVVDEPVVKVYTAPPPPPAQQPATATATGA